MYQSAYQINGTASHETIDNQRYSSKADILQGISVYSEKYGLVGKIDLFDINLKKLTERKRQVKQVYDGYVFQLYGQYYGLKESGYDVSSIQIHSIVDNKNYNILLPEENPHMLRKFEKVIEDIRKFDIETFEQDNSEKCRNCIYEPACDRCLK